MSREEKRQIVVLQRAKQILNVMDEAACVIIKDGDIKIEVKREENRDVKANR